MRDQIIIILLNAVITFTIGGGLLAWFKYGPERRKTRAETASLLLEDLESSYKRVCEDLAQVRMELIVREQEAADCRGQVQEMQAAMSLLSVEVSRQGRLSILARARAHLAGKTLLNYELHIDTLLDEMVAKKIEITPMMRTRKLREAYNAQVEKLEAMEAHELEALLKEQAENNV